MSAKTPLHVSPSRYAFSTYLYRCLAASFAEEPARATWQATVSDYITRPDAWEALPAPEHKLGETKA